MTKKQTCIFLTVVAAVIAALIVGIVLTDGLYQKEGSIQDAMQDAVLHEGDKISLFGLPVNPGLISAFVVTGVILVFAAIVRIFVIPRFKFVPGKFQMLLEQAVGMFDGLAKSNSPHRNNFLGAYVFAAGAYIFVSTLFELVGVPAVSMAGQSVILPAPLSDINGAISLGCLSYLVILGGGIVSNGLRGVGRTLKEFSLPISMSFRMFGALLSGMLVTELVYYYLALSFVLPVIVGILFTVLHASSGARQTGRKQQIGNRGNGMKTIGRKKMFVMIGVVLAVILAVLLAVSLGGGQNDMQVMDTVAVAAENVDAEQTADAEAASETDTAAPQDTADDSAGFKALAAGIAIGLAAGAGAAGMGIAVAKTSEAIARQPEAEGKIRSTLMLGLVFIETAIIYALIVAILVIFVL